MTAHSPAAAMLRAGLLLGALAGAVVIGVGALVGPASWRGAASGAVGVAIALLALSAGPLLLSVAGRVSPTGVMALGVAGYGFTVMVLAAGYALLGTVPWLAGDRVGYGLAAATAGSLAGQVRAVARSRVPVYADEPSENL